MNGQLAAALLLSLALVVLPSSPRRRFARLAPAAPGFRRIRSAGVARLGVDRRRVLRGCRRRIAAADDRPRRRGGGRNREPALPSSSPQPAGHRTRGERWKRRSTCWSANCEWARIRCARSRSPPTKPMVRLRRRCARSRRGPDWVPTSRPACAPRPARRRCPRIGSDSRCAGSWPADHGLAIADPDARRATRYR